MEKIFSLGLTVFEKNGGLSSLKRIQLNNIEQNIEYKKNCKNENTVTYNLNLKLCDEYPEGLICLVWSGNVPGCCIFWILFV